MECYICNRELDPFTFTKFGFFAQPNAFKMVTCSPESVDDLNLFHKLSHSLSDPCAEIVQYTIDVKSAGILINQTVKWAPKYALFGMQRARFIRLTCNFPSSFYHTRNAHWLCNGCDPIDTRTSGHYSYLRYLKPCHLPVDRIQNGCKLCSEDLARIPKWKVSFWISDFISIFENDSPRTCSLHLL